ncbi:MAG TPA: hypothetical protein P5081_16520 [Phycisphaerae bacterium]|nr:hypothetical protein [Phycisphaerae bacterium]HRW54476.1 hypothetical protein [Phycisphaerae bacterium]
MKKVNQLRLMRWGLVAGTLLFGILPGGCETVILRAVTPILLV